MRASIYLTRLGALLTLDRHYDGPDATRNTLRARWFSGRKDETSAPRLSLSLSDPTSAEPTVAALLLGLEPPLTPSFCMVHNAHLLL